MSTIQFNNNSFYKVLEEMRTVRFGLETQIRRIEKIRTILKNETDKFDENIERMLQNLKANYEATINLIRQGEQICRVYEEKESEVFRLVENLNNPLKKKAASQIVNIGNFGLTVDRITWEEMQQSRKRMRPDIGESSIPSKYFMMKMRHEAWLCDLADKRNAGAEAWIKTGRSGFIPVITIKKLSDSVI